MRRGVVGVVLLAAVAVGSTQALAAPATLVIDTRAPKLAEADGGGYTASVGLTNLTSVDAPLAVTATGDPGCRPTLDKPAVPAAEKVTAKLTIPAECALPGGQFKAVVTAGAARFDLQSAKPKAEAAKPDWNELRAFPILFFGLPLLAVMLFALFRDKEEHRLGTKLEHLDEGWSFKDSWVSNITIVAALLTGLIGSSDVLTAVLGDDAEGSLALATVGAAIAAAMVAAGPIVLVICKSGKSYTVGGLLLAAGIVLAGAAGQIWVTYRAGTKLDLGDAEDYLWLGAAAAGLLLLVYAYKSIAEVLAIGTTAPEKAKYKPSDAIVAAWIIVKELRRGRATTRRRGIAPEEEDAAADEAEDAAAFDQLQSDLEAMPPPARRRAAIL